MSGHRVDTFANGLSAKLATRSRHVCLFLGAGASRACGLPDIAALQSKVIDGLEPTARAEFERQLVDRSLEQALSRLRRIAALLVGQPDQIDGITGDRAAALDREVCRLIVAALDIEKADLSPVLYLSAWAARADYHLPVELFTVNYDLLLEAGLEALGVPYFDGFVGTLAARFRTDLVEAVPGASDAWLPAFLVRLWKLHGSVNWAWKSGDRAEVIRQGAPVADTEPAAIYPSDAKYDESRRVPFVVLQDRFRRALQHPETLTLVSGYSFGDAHLNEMIFEAARLRPRSEIIAFCFGDIPAVLAKQAEMSPNLLALGSTEAILGGVRDDWTAPMEAPADLWSDGKLSLPDFAQLATFLARSSSPESELQARLAEVLARATEDVGA